MNRRNIVRVVSLTVIAACGAIIWALPSSKAAKEPDVLATLERQITWSNELSALATLGASHVKSGDLPGLVDARYKAGGLFLESAGWEKADAKLAYLCSQAADALKNALAAAREGNMGGKPDSYSTQLRRWNDHHQRCSATAREMRGESPLKAGQKAG